LLDAIEFAGAEYEVSAHLRQSFGHLAAETDGAAGD